MLRTTLILGITVIFLAAAIIYAPGEAFQASGQGLTIWWRIVFPALLPFLVLVEILLASGFAHGLGVVVEPFTRKFLGLPGSFGWILPLGLTAGFPAVASACHTLHKQGKITQTEAERIVSTTHFCSPMLIIVVIGTGFFSHPALGLFLLIIHWLSGITAGITIYLFHSKSEPNANLTPRYKLTDIFKQMELARAEDGRSFGKLLGDSVASAVQTLMVTGGTILMFAVIIHVVVAVLPDFIPSGLPAGLLEIHLGAFTITNYTMPPAIVAAILGTILGWSGLSAFLQIRAIMGSAFKGRAFIIHRLVHSLYAYLLTLILWKPITSLLPGALPAFHNPISVTTISEQTLALHQFIRSHSKVMTDVLQFELVFFALLIAGILTASVIWSKRSDRSSR